MQVEAHIWYWTSSGMWEGVNQGTRCMEVAEAEQLLADAHRRGREQGMEEAKQVVREVIP